MRQPSLGVHTVDTPYATYKEPLGGLEQKDLLQNGDTVCAAGSGGPWETTRRLVRMNRLAEVGEELRWGVGLACGEATQAASKERKIQ